MKRLASIGYLVSTAALFMLGPGAAMAQSIDAATIGGLSLSASALNPAPGQTVTITASSYAIDINAATLTWTSGGKVLARGAGVTSITVQAPALGKHMAIDATAVASGGQTYNSSITLGSGYVDMILEPDGYVPPFFKGKLPVSYQNSVKAVAVPHLADPSGREYDPSTLVYQWEVGDNVLTDQSGYGRQSVILQNGLVPRTQIITVTVSTRSGSAQAQGIISMPQVSPSVMLYPDDPLYGPMFNRAIGSTAYIGSEKEMPVIAVPYGFDGFSLNGSGDLSLSWLINNLSHPELDGSDTVTLRAPSDGSSGASDIQLTVTNANDILQQAQAGFSAIFNQSSAASASVYQQAPVSF